ncbi:protein TIC 22-like, chloroplastic [Lotus japonicus]|uniref:protein TIC 22-like, chloroplastic n=1 Tax=Lotus japonicus TaxID=34305 RepID=UPI00258627DF|nr:protein TIC 22-like, chloroplastic [Lotus japonicus]
MNLDNFHKTFADLQTRCTTFVHNLTLLRPNPPPPPFRTNLPWARISQNTSATTTGPVPAAKSSIEQCLEGVPVYALSNAAEEFLLVSGSSTGKNLGLFCFNKDDAEALLHQVTEIDPHIRQGSKVVPVALNKVFQLKVDGVAFRLIPEFSQVVNALQEMEKSGLPSSDFSGVPVFESRSLMLKSQNKRYRPLFFRKEDLENSLQRAAREQNKLNPAIRQGDIQVTALEDLIKEMKEKSTSKWNDVVFIPPGFDVSTDSNQQ